MQKPFKRFLGMLLTLTLVLSLILAFTLTASAANVSWSNSTLPASFASGDTILVTSGASGTLNDMAITATDDMRRQKS